MFTCYDTVTDRVVTPLLSDANHRDYSFNQKQFITEKVNVSFMIYGVTPFEQHLERSNGV